MVEYRSARVDRVFAALADPTHRSVRDALSRRPATITEFARPFPVSLNAISKHVKVFERAGLVRREVVSAATSASPSSPTSASPRPRR